MASSTRAAKAAVSQSNAGQNTAQAWAVSWLTAIGAPVTQNNIDNVIRWGIAESGTPGSNQGHGGWTNFNPFNVVTQSNDNHVGQGGTQGNIADFGNMQDGVNASARLFLNNSNAAGIISAFRSNASTSTLNSAINSFYSSWGGSINLTGVTPTGGGLSLGSGQATQDVQTTAYIPGTHIHIPFTGAGSSWTPGWADAFVSVAKFFLNIGDNWRYVLEVFAGLGLIAFGVLLILFDTGAVRSAAKHAPEIAALAAA